MESFRKQNTKQNKSIKRRTETKRKKKTLSLSGCTEDEESFLSSSLLQQQEPIAVRTFLTLSQNNEEKKQGQELTAENRVKNRRNSKKSENDSRMLTVGNETESCSIKSAEKVGLLRKKKKNLWYTDKEIYSQTNIKDLNKLIKSLLKKGLPKAAANIILKKWKRRECRRLKRQEDRITSKVCFGCRLTGHELSSCPTRSKSDGCTGICFKCGSTEHTISKCKKHVKGFPFAECFICGEQGHLSKHCESNPNGIYPKGGTCMHCGMRDHLVKDCPDLLNKVVTTCFRVSKIPQRNHVSADEEDNVLLASDVKGSGYARNKVIKF